MINQIKKWTLRLTVTVLFVAGCLVVIILNPTLTYANKTTFGNYVIFHDQPLDKILLTQINEAARMVNKSEYYNPDLKLDICLNDGSIYPAMIRWIFGQGFGWGFYNKVVLGGNAHYKENRDEINGYRWNMTQLLAHEMMHCFQVNKRGLWRSHPVAKIQHWKWEGYPEYISRQHADQKDLVQNIHRLVATERTDNNGWIQFSDSTGTVIPYYNMWLLVQFSMDVKMKTYDQVIDDTAREETVRQQMMEWYGKQK